MARIVPAAVGCALGAAFGLGIAASWAHGSLIFHALPSWTAAATVIGATFGLALAVVLKR